MARVWLRVAAMVAVVIVGVTVKDAAGNPYYGKVYYKADCPLTTTTILVTTTKTEGEVIKTVHQARYVITSTETVHRTEYSQLTKTVYQNAYDHHTHTKYVVNPVTVTERSTEYDTKTVTHLQEKTTYVPTTVTKTHCGYGDY